MVIKLVGIMQVLMRVLHLLRNRASKECLDSSKGRYPQQSGSSREGKWIRTSNSVIAFC
jgi:hypothetical protein